MRDQIVRSLTRGINAWWKNDFLVLVVHKEFPVIRFGKKTFLRLDLGFAMGCFARTDKVMAKSSGGQRVKSFVLVHFVNEFLEGGFNVGED